MIKNIQYYINNTNTNPYYNLSLEKVLFDTIPENTCILYLWQNENTVVIGKNQNPLTECNCKLLESENGKIARRLSGGGAVYHDLGNLNFTFICHTVDYDLNKNLTVIKNACKKFGIDAEISGRNDILVQGRKFSGNAFYNSQGKSYHHGTVLISSDINKVQKFLTPSKEKLNAKGVKSVKSRVINLSDISNEITFDKMKKAMIEAFEDVYNLKTTEIKNTDLENPSKYFELYSSWNYIYGSSPPFNFSCDGHFSWGNIQVQLEIIKGIIQSVNIYTDSMDWNLSSNIKNAITGKTFEFEIVKKALDLHIETNLSRDITNLIFEF